MPRNRLDAADERFMIPLEIIDGGSGRFMGLLDEPNQNAPAAYIFSHPRRMLRVNFFCPVHIGMVIRSPEGAVFLVAAHGASEVSGGVFKSFRLFEATAQLPWRRRGTTIDPVTHLETEGPEQDLGDIWVAYEPEQREAFDRQFRASFETARILTNKVVMRDDKIGELRAVRVDETLGLFMVAGS